MTNNTVKPVTKIRRSGYQRGPTLGASYLKHLEIDLSLGVDIYALLATLFANMAKFFSHVYYWSNKVIKLIV